METYRRNTSRRWALTLLIKICIEDITYQLLYPIEILQNIMGLS
ncbi:hypothetical protein ACSVDA_15655 [Cytobacillus sp. Hm23]